MTILATIPATPRPKLIYLNINSATTVLNYQQIDNPFLIKFIIYFLVLKL